MEHPTNNTEQNNTNKGSFFRRVGKRLDSFVDSGLGVTTLVLAGLPVYYFGSDLIQPMVDGVFNLASYISLGRASDSSSMSMENINLSNAFSGLVALSTYAMGMGPVIHGCVRRNRNGILY